MHPLNLAVVAAALMAIAAPVQADGDIAAGEKDFGKCRACHMIADGDNVIRKGGKTGPNLFQVVGRPAAIEEGFAYGTGIKLAAEKGLVWTTDQLEEYIHDPSKFLTEYVGEKEQSKMTFKMKNSQDVVAYLASLGEYPAESGD